MTSSEATHSRERLGWAFLLVAFTIFVAIAISVPIAINLYLQDSKQPLPTSVQANQGTVRIDDLAGVMRATSAGEAAQAIESGAEILTDATATALVLVQPPNSEQVLARVQVYGNTNLGLDVLDAPRFEVSESEHRAELTLHSGRLNVTVTEFQDRVFVLWLYVPQGEIAIREPGQYSIEVTNALTQVAVQSGRAELSTGADELLLTVDQRGVIPRSGELQGPLDTERNLVRNGDFADGLDQWTQFTWRVELSEQPEGIVNVQSIGGEDTLRIVRNGDGHADVLLRQAINQDVADYQTLRLLLTFRIINQDLGVCGVQGSECPIFLRVNYVDINGVSRTWQHGFYSTGQVSPGTTPDACVSCDVVQSTHQFVQLGQIHFFEIDFRADLARQGFLPPRLIESVALVSSGHTFAVDVMEVAFMAKE